MSIPVHTGRLCVIAGLLTTAVQSIPAVARGGWVKDAVQPGDVDRDLIQFKYEAESPTAAIGTNTRLRTVGDAVSQDVTTGIVQSMKQYDLIKSCVRA